MTDLPLLLWTAIDQGDDAAYAALIDYYLEAGNETAAEGVRRAAPTRRRPFRWSGCEGILYTWCRQMDLWPVRSGLTLDDLAVPARLFDHPTAAWEFLATLPEPAHAIPE